MSTGGDNDSGHGHFEDDLAAYALGALDDQELGRFEAHLTRCAKCQKELAAVRKVVQVLPASAPTRAPSDELKDRVMTTIRSEAANPAAPVEASQRRTRTRGRRPIVTRPGWLNPAVAIAAVGLVAVLVVVGALTLGSGGGAARTYAGIVYAPGASASLRRSGNTAQLRVSRLPAPPPGRIYQVWLERAAQAPTPTRALFANGNGSITVPGNLRRVQLVLVTAEPRPDGSLAPTRPPIIVVRLA